MRRTAVILATALAACAPVATATVADAATPAGQSSVVTKKLRTAISGLPVAIEKRSGYARTKFKLWIDADKDGCNTRAEVLIAESKTKVKRKNRCTITSGKWYSYYDKKYWTKPADVDIDHVVPLAEAWDSGARAWNADTRQRYANDLTDSRTLVAVTDNVNQSKGDRDPGQWLPKYNECTYIRQWAAVKLRWALSVNTNEKKTLTAQAKKCSNVTIKVTKAKIVKASTGGGTSGGSTKGTAQFTRIVYDAPGSDTTANANKETVTITNTSKTTISVKGWRLTDATKHRYTFPAFTLKKSATVTVHSGKGKNTTAHLYAGWNHVWNNTGDTATLTRANGTRLDRCTWTKGSDTTTC